MASPGEEAATRPRRRRGPVAILSALALGTIVGSLLIEGLTRIFFDEAVQPRFFVDTGYGVRGVKPNIDTRHHMPGEYDVRVTTNSVGMRGQREYSPDPAPNVKRVLVIGDSFGFGFGVEDDEVISAVLEDRLNAQAEAPMRYEVINQSVSGSGQAEQLVAYHAWAHKYHPQVAILLYFDNDIGNNAVAGLYDRVGESAVKRNGNEFLPAVRSQELLYAVPPIRWLFEHSEAWNLVRNRLSGAVQNTLLRRKGLEHYDDVQPEAVGLTKALLRQFAADLRADGADVILVVIPNSNTGMSSNFPLTADEVQELGVTFVEGRDYLTRDDYYPRDGHWRPSGHRKVAERLANLIAR